MVRPVPANLVLLREARAAAEAVKRQLQQIFTPEVVDELRAETGYNPRQRVATAFRLMLTVVEACLLGQTLSFAALPTSSAKPLTSLWPSIPSPIAS
jgi:hypothetical protein